jgi:PEP-CTERM motif
MKKVLVVLALLLVPGIALALPTIHFDTTPNGAGGTLTYNGAGGPLVGTNIQFVVIQGVDTPLNNLDTLACTDCFLNFTTGANLTEGPNQWTWAAGGTFTLIGDVVSLGLDDAVLVSGTFTDSPVVPTLAAVGGTAALLSFGVDTKNEVLASHYGLGTDFSFANSELALGTFVLNPATAGFTASPTNADLDNVTVPEPATLLLLGSGLVGAVAFKRRRMQSQKLPV